MVKNTNHAKQEIRGLQRRAVFRALIYPASGAILTSRARHWAPKIGITEVRRCIRDFEDKGWVHSLNPDDTKNGRIYALTSLGARLYEEEYEVTPSIQLLYEGEISSLSVVLRSHLVRYVFSVMMQDVEPQWHSATSIKSRLRHIHSTGISGVVILAGRMVKEGYFEMTEEEVKDHLEKQYRMTDIAVKIYQEVLRINHPHNWQLALESENSLVNENQVYKAENVRCS